MLAREMRVHSFTYSAIWW